MKIISIILQILKNLFNFKKINEIEKINKKLEKSITDKIILKGKILKMLRRFTNVGGKSKYIPLTRKNREEIRQRVLAEFGSEMELLNVKINDKLELS